MEVSINRLLTVINGLPDTPQSLQQPLQEIIDMLKSLQNIEVEKTRVENIKVGDSAFDTRDEEKKIFTAPRSASNIPPPPPNLPSGFTKKEGELAETEFNIDDSDDEGDAEVRKVEQGPAVYGDDVSEASFETSNTGPQEDKILTVTSDPHTTKAVLNGGDVEIPGYVSGSYHRQVRLPKLVNIMKEVHSEMNLGAYPESQISKMQRSSPLELKNVLNLGNQSILADVEYGLNDREKRKEYYDKVKEKFNEWQKNQEPGPKSPGINELAGNIEPGTSYFEVEFPFHENTKIRIEDKSFRRGGKNKKKTKRKKGGKSKNNTVKYRRRNNRKRGKK